MQNFKKLTILCPIFNEERVIGLFFEKMLAVINKLPKQYIVNLVFLNNCSTDTSLQVIEKIREEHPFVYVITFTTNVGYQRSLESGLKNTKGDIFTFIDVDCEDPPELIHIFLLEYEKGYDLVYGERIDREEIKVLKQLRKIFYHIVRWAGDEDIILYMAEFSLFTSDVRDAVISEQNSFPFIRSSLARVGFKRIGIPYKRHKRIAGETHYNLMGMTVFAVASILSSTTLPLRLPIYFFIPWMILNIALGLLFLQNFDAGYLVVLALNCCAYMGLTIAFISLYVARTYKNGLDRPNAFIHKKLSHLQPN